MALWVPAGIEIVAGFVAVATDDAMVMIVATAGRQDVELVIAVQLQRLAVAVVVVLALHMCDPVGMRTLAVA